MSTKKQISAELLEQLREKIIDIITIESHIDESITTSDTPNFIRNMNERMLQHAQTHLLYKSRGTIIITEIVEVTKHGEFESAFDSLTRLDTIAVQYLVRGISIPENMTIVDNIKQKSQAASLNKMSSGTSAMFPQLQLIFKSLEFIMDNAYLPVTVTRNNLDKMQNHESIFITATPYVFIEKVYDVRAQGELVSTKNQSNELIEKIKYTQTIINLLKSAELYGPLKDILSKISGKSINLEPADNPESIEVSFTKLSLVPESRVTLDYGGILNGLSLTKSTYDTSPKYTTIIVANTQGKMVILNEYINILHVLMQFMNIYNNIGPSWDILWKYYIKAREHHFATKSVPK